MTVEEDGEGIGSPGTGVMDRFVFAAVVDAVVCFVLPFSLFMGAEQHVGMSAGSCKSPEDGIKFHSAAPPPRCICRRR